MAPDITFTFDLEDHRPGPTWEARYPRFARKALDFLDERGIRATVFVVGRIAERSPDLVQEVAARGHEVGLHNYEHWALFSCPPDTFAREVGDARARLQDLTGQEVLGFRAPAGTLVPRSYWATEALAEAGFGYSASVLPAQTYGVGFPGAPPEPFRWPSGLVEAPCPCLRYGPLGLPIMGGTFLRVLPLPLVQFGSRRLPDTLVPWVYAHPYDLDTLERFWLVPEVRWWGSILLWLNRGRILTKLDRVVQGRVGEPLGERLRALEAVGRIQTWHPDLDDDGRPTMGGVTGRLARALQRDKQFDDMATPLSPVA
jgi:peptidoglycan-N-acetylglucosamine deacetylase